MLDGINKEMRDSDVAYYGRLFNQWCHGTGMPTIDHPADEYFVQVARFDPSKGTIDVLDSYPMFRTHLTQTKPDRRPQNESSADMGLTMIQTQVKCPTWLWILFMK